MKLEAKGELTGITALLKQCENLGKASDLIVNIEDKGITISVIDASHVALFTGSIKKEYFKEYTAEAGTTVIDWEKLYKVLTLIGKNTEFILKIKENYLYLQTDKTSYRMGLYTDKETKLPRLPELEFTSSFIAQSSEFLTACKLLETIEEDSIKFFITTKGIEIKGNNNKDEVIYSIPSDNLKEFSLKKKKIKAEFSVDFLKSFLKNTSVEELKIEMETDIPIKFTTLINSNIESTYLVAPRIEDDNEKEEEEDNADN